MSPTVAELYSEALQLSDEARIELAERLIESSEIAPGLVEEQLEIVRERVRMQDAGLTREIPGEEAHQRVMRAISGQP